VPRPTGPVNIDMPITIRSLSSALAIQANVLIQKLMMDQGQMLRVTDIIPEEMAEMLALEHDVELVIRRGRDVEAELQAVEEGAADEGDLLPRAPVFTFLGHVDHGKTTLMDAIRKTSVVDTESGGITQHTSAYRVYVGEKSATFIDTPGHEAFSEMRSRGANVTDIVVLVVAADDGVMPQTIEAISHAKAAGVPIVVALNKVDKANAAPEKVMNQLLQYELIPEEYGGAVGVVKVSALNREGIDELLERIMLEAEILELKANPDQDAWGTVIEAHISVGRGSVTTVLVREGTLETGDVILCSNGYGRVRSMFNDQGEAIVSAGPSMPVEVSGLDQVPVAGDRFHVLKSLDDARQVAADREDARRNDGLNPHRESLSLENLASFLSTGTVESLKVILRADVMGTLEAIKGQLSQAGSEEVKVHVMHAGVGAVNASDVQLAHTSNAIVLAYRVGVEPAARVQAEQQHVDIRMYDVIYDLLDEIKLGLEGLLAPEEKEVIEGHAEVRNTFRISSVGTVAGCFVLDGTIGRRSRIRMTRDGNVIWTGGIDSLKRFKDDVAEVRGDFECGIRLAGYDDVKVGDTYEAFHIEKIKRTLD
jgi:translation initiation factor IF-2